MDRKRGFGIAATSGRVLDGEPGFVMCYQPRISLADGRLTGFEAFPRPNQPQSATRILRDACRQMARWQKELPVEPRLTIGVNISPEHLIDASLVAEIEQILAEARLNPGSLRLEMTERKLMMCGEVAITTLYRLRAMQIGLEIDDFGTGHASLSYLRNLPFDTIRIDRSFVRQLGTLNDSSAIILAIVTFARSLGMNVDAEGVDTEEHRRKLIALGCRCGQGACFCGPLAVSRAGALIQDQLRDGFKLRPAVRLVSGQRVSWYTR